MGKPNIYRLLAVLLLVPLLLGQPGESLAAGGRLKIPDSVKDISRQNTYPNPSMDPEYVQPSSSTLELFKTTNYEIENPNLIRLLNETTIQPSKLAIGFRANIYLGNWALNYESKETSVNWEYKQANLNKLDNRGGRETSELTYEQQEEFTAVGGLTTDVLAEEDVRKLMIAAAKQNTGLNLAFESTVGKGTKQETIMRVPAKKIGYLQAYVPAASERGNITYGEVYLNIQGSEKKLIIKNVTHKGVGAWIPVQDKLSFKYSLSENPKTNQP
ncbi:YfkD family protein [Ammoniphilus sp. YIM 78166]|uniref:YfkD family protein n=1 Tax=Ammoniphilus sp. YIM 78166 TaxID=1644106 RepID=UPI0014310D79|nr:YfkD family protein [Ammoniphilus sp. YIM 78166]